MSAGSNGGTLSECQALGPLLYNPGQGARLRQNDTGGQRAGGQPRTQSLPSALLRACSAGRPTAEEKSPGRFGGGHRGEPSGPLTEAVLVPAVGVAPGHGHGDGAQLAGFGGINKHVFFLFTIYVCAFICMYEYTHLYLQIYT